MGTYDLRFLIYDFRSAWSLMWRWIGGHRDEVQEEARTKGDEGESEEDGS